MFDLSNITSLMTAMAGIGLGPTLTFLLVLFTVVAGVWLVSSYIHDRHIEALAKGMTDTTTMAVQSIQNMVTMAIAATQGIDVTNKVLDQTRRDQGK